VITDGALLLEKNEEDSTRLLLKHAEGLGADPKALAPTPM